MSGFSANTLRSEIVLSGKMIRLISSEGTPFDVPVEICVPSTHITDTLNMSSEEELPTMDLVSINTNTLKAIITFLSEYVAEPFSLPLPKTLPEAGLNSLLRPFYVEFMNIKIISDGTCDPATFTGEVPPDASTITDLLQAADTLGIVPLKKLMVAKLSDVVRGKNIKDMFKIFNIEDHVPEWEEFERIRKEHAYAFEDREEDE
jgi:hypothetical protein